MFLKLHVDHLQAIQAHAARAYPEECCGLLLGKVTTDSKTVDEVYAVPNAWDTEVANELDDRTALTNARRYSIAPADMLAGMRVARQRNLEVIGIYHSHPDHPAVPSDCDRALAWSHYSYLIVSVEQGIAKDCRSWALSDRHVFESETIQLAETARM